jgi:hypothetical protein
LIHLRWADLLLLWVANFLLLLLLLLFILGD